MTLILTNRDKGEYKPLFDGMHADRKRVFVDILGWDIPHDDQFEVDQFDDDLAEYFIVADKKTGDHLGSLRLLRTDRDHILGTLFPHLCEGEVPVGPDIREITRLCLSPRAGAATRLRTRNILARSLIEYGLMTGVRAYTGVAEIAWLSQILSAGWRCDPLGLPQLIHGEMLGALRIDVDVGALTSFAPGWRCEPVPMRVLGADIAFAA